MDAVRFCWVTHETTAASGKAPSKAPRNSSACTFSRAVVIRSVLGLVTMVRIRAGRPSRLCRVSAGRGDCGVEERSAGMSSDRSAPWEQTVPARLVRVVALAPPRAHARPAKTQPAHAARAQNLQVHSVPRAGYSERRL